MLNWSAVVFGAVGIVGSGAFLLTATAATPVALAGVAIFGLGAASYGYVTGAVNVISASDLPTGLATGVLGNDSITGKVIDLALGCVDPEPTTIAYIVTLGSVFLFPLVDLARDLARDLASDLVPAVPATGIPNSETRDNSSGNALVPAIVVSSNPLQITADAGSTEAMADFVVENQGDVGSVLVYTLQGSLSGGSLSFQPQQPPSGGLEYNQSDSYVVTVTVPGGFQGGLTYTGTIIISANDPNLSKKPVTVPVKVTVPAPAAVISAQPQSPEYHRDRQFYQHHGRLHGDEHRSTGLDVGL